VQGGWETSIKRQRPTLWKVCEMHIYVVNVDTYLSFLTLDHVCVLVGMQMRPAYCAMLPCNMKQTASSQSPLTATSRVRSGTFIPRTTKIGPLLSLHQRGFID